MNISNILLILEIDKTFCRKKEVKVKKILRTEGQFSSQENLWVDQTESKAYRNIQGKYNGRQNR